MNATLGARIKILRESKGLTQEQLAEKLSCSRQKYARLEKGLVDISYANISTIAQVLEIKIEEITSAVNTKHAMFRKTGFEQDDQFAFISNMLDTFYAHRKLYNSVRQAEIHE